MSNKKISELVQATQVNDNDELAIVQSGTTKRVTKQVLQDSLSVESGTTINLEPVGTLDNATLAIFGSGNSVDFGASGVRAGTLEFDTSNPIRGKQSLLYSNHATPSNSTNDWVSRTLDVPKGYTDKVYELNVQYISTYTTGNLNFYVKDNYGRVILEEVIPYYLDGNKATEFSRRLNIYENVAQITYGFQIVSGEASAYFKLDDIQVTPNLRSITSFVATETPDSTIRVQGANGCGSTNNKIRRFTNILISEGSAVSYTDSASLGSAFTVEQDGIYHINYVEWTNGSQSSAFGISLNTTQPTTEIVSLSNVSEILAISQNEAPTAPGSPSVASWSGYLKKGDVVRPHINNNTLTNAAAASFTMSKVGSLNLTATLQDQTIEIPTSELRYEQATAVGTGAELGNIKFTNLMYIKGKALSADNSNATIITVLEDGWLTAHASIYQTATTTRNIFITRNVANPAADPLLSEIIGNGHTGSGNSGGATASVYVKTGDKIRVRLNGGVTPSNSTIFFTVTHQKQAVQVSVSNIEPQYEDVESLVRLNGTNGFGATNTVIRRFSSVLLNSGSAITYTDSAAFGASFTINEDGFYAISYTDLFGAAARFGISKNATQLTTGIGSITPENVLAMALSGSANWAENVAWSGKLLSGDVIRPHCDSGSDNSSPTLGHFYITKIPLPSIVGIDGRPLDAYQELEDYALFGRGNNGSAITADTTDIHFSTISDNTGGWSGTIFTVPETGLWTISLAVHFNSDTGRYLYLYKNGSNYYTFGYSNVTPHSGTVSLELAKGDTLSFRVSGGGTLANVSTHNLSITRRRDLIRAIPLVDSTIEIPTSTLIYNGATGRGTSTESRTVQFTTLGSIGGDAFSIDNSNGTKITVNKAGIVNITTSVLHSALGTTSITLNQANNTTDPTVDERRASLSVNGGEYAGVSASFPVVANDIIRINNNNGIASSTSNKLLIVHQEQSSQIAISNVKPQFEDVDSMIRLYTGNGYGSTATRIKRFAAVAEIQGSAITYTDSATDGASFTINEDGVYSISYTDSFTSLGTVGLTKNAPSLTTVVYDASLNPYRLAMSTTTGAGNAETCAWTGYLSKGDIIRPHVDTAGTQEIYTAFTITKQALPSIAEVDITPFVDLNQQVYQASEWKNLGPITITATTTPPNKGTVVYDSVKGRRNGRHLELRYEYEHNAAGTSGTGEYFFSIPSTFDGETIKIDPSVVELSTSVIVDTHSTIGHGYIYNDTSRSEIAAIPYDATRFRVLASYSGTSGFISNGHFSFGAVNVGLGFMVTIPVLGWEDYSSEYERVYAVEDNENVFSARIANNGTASVTSKNADFIEAVSRTALGNVTITFKAGLFTEIPSVTASYVSNSTNTGREISVRTVSLTEVIIDTFTYSTGVNFDCDFTIHVQRQGQDYRDLQRQIVSLTDFPRVNKTISQQITHFATGGTLLDGSNEFRFNLSNLTQTGDSILSIEDDPANTRTKFVALKECTVTITCQAGVTSIGYSVSVFKNGNIFSQGPATSSASYPSQVASVMKLLPSDYVTVGINGNSTTNDILRMSIVAEAQELTSVGNLEGGENVFSARISSTGTVTSQSGSSPWISSVSKTGPGAYTIYFVPGLFSVPPSITGAPGLFSRQFTYNNTTLSTSLVSIEMSSATGTAEDNHFTITATRQGSDYRDPQEQILQLSNFPRINNTLSQEIRLAGAHAGFGASWTSNKRFSGLTSNTGDRIIEYYQDSTLGDYFVATKKARVTISWNGFYYSTSSGTVTISKNQTGSSVLFAENFSGNLQSNSTATLPSGLTATGVLEAGDVIRFYAQASNFVGSSEVIKILAEAQELERTDSVDEAVNTYSLRITAANPPVVLFDNENIVQSTTYNTTGQYTITIRNTVFTEIPDVISSSNNSNRIVGAEFTNPTTLVIGQKSDAGAFIDGAEMSFLITKQGADYKRIQDVVVALPESKVLWQKKTMTTVNTPSQMNFSNLVIGKTYRLSLHAYMQVDGNESSISVEGVHNGTGIVKLLLNGGTGTDIALEAGDSIVFIATATTVTFSQASTGASPSVAANRTWAVLEELPLHQQTSQW